MIEPQSTAVTICPICRNKIRSTAEHCLHCGAERIFGPRSIETAIYSFAGMVLLSALSTEVVPLSLWTILFATIGLAAGFLLAHNRFGDNRWTKP